MDIYHEKCCCLHIENVKNDLCLKRYYTVFDIEKGQHIILHICNELIRCLINKRKHILNKCSYKDRVFYTPHIYSDVIESIVSEYVNIDSVSMFGSCYDKNNLLNQIISVQILEKPYMSRNIYLKDLVFIQHVNNNIFLKDLMLNVVSRYLINMFSKKYISRYRNMRKLINEIRITWEREEKNVMINDLFLLIYNLNIKENGTSKQ